MKRLIVLFTLILTTLNYAKAQNTSIAALDNMPNTLTSPTNDSTSILKAYCGTYMMKDNPYVEDIKLMVKDGQLMSLTPEGEEVILLPTEEPDTFFIAMLNAKVVFRRENDSIIGLKAVVQGKEIVGFKNRYK
jgi:hypothetical protein